MGGNHFSKLRPQQPSPPPIPPGISHKPHIFFVVYILPSGGTPQPNHETLNYSYMHFKHGRTSSPWHDMIPSNFNHLGGK